ncbi:MAG: hypothetical protein ACHQYP_04570, partial [Nitrospiria bacterium]
GGYTMTGSQETVEGANNLSIPAVLNGALITSLTYQKTNGTNVPSSGSTNPTSTSNDGALSIPQSVHLFLGGRISEHIGFIAESCLEAACTANGGPLTGFKMLFIDGIKGLKDVQVGAIPFSYGQGGAGVAYSFELLNTGAVALHAFNQQDMATISAQQYVAVIGPAGPNSAASGIALVATNPIGFVNFAKWQSSHFAGGTNGSPTSNYLRVAATSPGELINGWDIGFGGQIWSGSSVSVSPASPVLYTENDTEAFALDAQFLGYIDKLPLTLIASYATAKGNDPLNPVQNLFNSQARNIGGAQDKSSFNIGAELGIIPFKATLQAGIRHAKSGINETGPSLAPGEAGAPIPGTNAEDDALMIGATYALAQNMRFTLTFSQYSGSYYSATSIAKSPGGTGDQQTWVALESDF